MKCPICTNSHVKVIGKPGISNKVRNFIKDDYYVLKCRDCQFYFIAPPITLNKDAWIKLYDENYFGEMTKWWKNRRARERKDRFNRLEKYSNQKIMNFLDIGCGEGFTLVEASERGWKAYGVDVSDNRVNSARGKDIFFKSGDLFNAQFPNNYFDCIYMDSVLEHVVNPIIYLRELKRIMREGGILYVGVPNEGCLFNDIKKLLYVLLGKNEISVRIKPFIEPYHVVGFTKKSLITACIQTNFKIVRFRNFAGLYELLKFRVFSKPFLINLFLVPVHLIAIPIRKQIYFEVILKKEH